MTSSRGIKHAASMAIGRSLRRFHKELLLELLFAVARRPSSSCIRRAYNNSSSTVIAYKASTSSTSQPHLRSPPQPSKISPRADGASRSTATATSIPRPVPLRMLLDRNPANKSAISKIPIPRAERGEKFTPSPLSRPVGLPYPPLPGQNVPQSGGSWSERRTAFVDPDNVQARRRLLVRNFMRPYYQEWKRLDHWKGKTFVGNERLFRGDKALWFPNMWGWTLAHDGAEGKDTTPALRGKVSLVGIQSGAWAEEQVGTFLGAEANPQLKAMLEANKKLVQKVEINIQDRWFRSFLVKLFKGRLRRMRSESEWSRYFSVRLGRDTGMGLTEDVRDAMGLLNSQVGYVYLLDTECRIRWAGSGHAWAGETKSLNAGVQKLIQEAKQPRSSAPQVTRPVPPLAQSVREGSLQEEVERALA